MRIETRKLELLFQKVIAKLKDHDIDYLDLNQDLYLLIANSDWRKIDESNPEPVTGSLVDGWRSLSKVVTEDNPIMFVDFDRLSSILRAISEKLNPGPKQ